METDPSTPQPRGFPHFTRRQMICAGASGVAGLMDRKFSGDRSLLIRGGTIIDGTGSVPVLADVLVVGDAIARVGRVQRSEADEMVDAEGLIVCPGFIDSHSHVDRGLEKDRFASQAVLQGVTTAVCGQDGGHFRTMDAWKRTWNRGPFGINIASFTGHGTLRQEVMGADFKRPARIDEIETMKRILEKELQSGSLGLSSGLEYDPGHYASTDELISLASAIKPYDGLYISHLRDEGNGAVSAIQELISIAERAGVRAQISHIKLATKPVWGKGKAVVTLINQARGRGMQITADIYPYLFWQSTITALTVSREFESLDTWEKALAEVGGSENVRLSHYSPNPAWQGKTIAWIANELRKPAPEVVRLIVRETQPPKSGTESVIVTAMTEADFEAFLSVPWTMICSDGSLRGTHPRGAGAFPRVIRKYVHERRVFSMPEAIRRMTWLPASTMRITGRGKIAAGFAADLLLIDLDSLSDLATVEHPVATPVGIRAVMINGRFVAKGGEVLGAANGQLLTRS